MKFGKFFQLCGWVVGWMAGWVVGLIKAKTKVNPKLEFWLGCVLSSLNNFFDGVVQE